MAFLRFDAWSVVLNDYSAALDALRCDVWGTEVVRPVVAAGDGDAVEEDWELLALDAEEDAGSESPDDAGGPVCYGIGPGSLPGAGAPGAGFVLVGGGGSSRRCGAQHLY